MADPRTGARNALDEFADGGRGNVLSFLNKCVAEPSKAEHPHTL